MVRELRLWRDRIQIQTMNKIMGRKADGNKVSLKEAFINSYEKVNKENN